MQYWNIQHVLYADYLHSTGILKALSYKNYFKNHLCNLLHVDLNFSCSVSKLKSFVNPLQLISQY